MFTNNLWRREHRSGNSMEHDLPASIISLPI